MTMTGRSLYSVVFTICSIFILHQPCGAADAWNFKRTYESKPVIGSPFILFTAADVDRNGIKELIVTDFGRSGDHIEEWKQWKKNIYQYDLRILEWEKDGLLLRFQKEWNTSKLSDAESNRYFMAYRAKQIVPWELGGEVMVETIPPYLGIKWQHGRYVLLEQQGWAQTKKPLVGSWVFPWLSASCYQDFPNKPEWPRECVYGIRDISGNPGSEIITIFEEEITKNKQYKQTVRVRRNYPGFPTVWQGDAPRRFVSMEPIDRFNKSATAKLLMRVFRTREWYVFEPIDGAFSFKAMSFEGSSDLELYDLPDVYLRATQRRKHEEYWGYRRVPVSDPKSVNFILLLRKVVLKDDKSGFLAEDIDFSHHKSFLGVGYFNLHDIDGDGLEEIILVEETAGKLSFGEEAVYYSGIKDYIHVLKWDGSKYRTMWVSPPYTKRGTKFIVEDIKNTGKKQLVVLSPYGTVQIWEKQ